MIALKFLRSGARSLFQPLSWPLSAAGGPSAWLEAAPGPLVACRNGLHACEVSDLAFWISDELWEVELDGERIRAPDALVARRARLVRRIERWDEAGAREAFSDACIARATAACAGLPSDHLATQYLEQVAGFARAGNHSVAAYVAALTLSAVAPSADARTAFRTERREQGLLLATIVGVG